MTTLHLTESIGRTALRRGLPRVQPIWIIRGLLLTLAALVCFALMPAPKSFGVSPAPDGGYPGNNTAEGSSALSNLTSGTSNTANGAFALFFNTTGSNNTAEGTAALVNNTSGNNNTSNGVNALYLTQLAARTRPTVCRRSF